MRLATLPLIVPEQERAGFFGQGALDTGLPDANAAFWTALIEHIRADAISAPHSVLDIGSHSGGLMARLLDTFAPQRILGIEPVATLRRQAAYRLARHAGDVELLDLSGWDRIAPSSIDLITCHEMLYLEPDLPGFMARLAKVLTSGSAAYVVLGCHAENPVWRSWKPAIEAMGIKVYDRSPFDILAEAGRAGLAAVVQPLRRTGWVSYDPRYSEFRYPDAESMFDHQYRHKLLFRFTRP